MEIPGKTNNFEIGSTSKIVNYGIQIYFEDFFTAQCSYVGGCKIYMVLE
jgi:hypothetical protein